MIRRSVILAVALLASTASPALADGLIDNVNGMTLDDKGKVVNFTGLVIDNDGKVKALLARRDKRPERPDYKLDGEGRTLMPGLIDAHGHVMGLGFSLLTLDLSTTRSLDEALAKIKAYADENPTRPWIIGRGWNQEKWGLGRFPTAADLDAVVSDRPVWLERVDGHAGWANSEAIRIAGVKADAKDPPGGRIERIGGKPAGVFVDAAEALIAKSVPSPRAVDRDAALIAAQDHLLSLGITAIADMGTSLDDWQAYRRAGDEGRLKLRIMGYASGIDAMVAIAGPRPTPWLYDDRLRLNGVKLYLDGALGSRGALLKADYADAPGQRGLAFVGDTQLLNMMSRAAMDDFQVAAHAIGDAANAQVLGAIEQLADDYKGDRRWRIEHAQIIDPLDVPRLARHGIIASMQPVHQISDRLMTEARLGPDRLAGAYAWKTISDAGVKLAFGSDTPVESPDPFAGLAAAITREGADGQPFGGWQPQERLSRVAAIDAFTRSAAFAGFAESRFGTLQPGMRADFVLIDTDPLLSSPTDVRNTSVVETWVGGLRRYQRDIKR
ncbi:amidohydrolase [Blastomonas sp.]|uniref:amidohydrolase n=1 Tax=Blastomonas sp. TaxID=1909299 RepID=UPI0035942D2C